MATTFTAPAGSPSTDDMLSGFSEDLFAGTGNDAPAEDTTGTDASAETPVDDETIDIPDEVGETDPQPPTEQPPAEPEPEPEPIAAKTETPVEEEIEGVRPTKTRAGKEGMFVAKDKWTADILPSYKLAQEASQILGEPLTIDAIKLRNEALETNDNLFRDLNSADATKQGGLIDYLFGEMARAQKDGLVGSDPAVSFTRTLFQRLEAQPNSPARNALRYEASKALISELFESAEASGDKNLFMSLGHVVRELTGAKNDTAAIRDAANRMGYRFHTAQEMGQLKPDPVTRLQRENQRLMEQLNGRQQGNQKNEVDAFFRENASVIAKSLDEGVIAPALSSIADAWTKLPTQYKSLIIEPIKRDLVAKIKEDQSFMNRMAVLDEEAARATSASARESFRDRIKSAWTNKAKLIIDAVKRPHIEAATTIVKTGSDANHARRAEAQNKTSPKGASAAVPRSIVPDDLGVMPNGVFDENVAIQQMNKRLANLR